MADKIIIIKNAPGTDSTEIGPQDDTTLAAVVVEGPPGAPGLPGKDALQSGIIDPGTYGGGYNFVNTVTVDTYGRVTAITVGPWPPLPDQTGQTGKVLGTDGNNIAWVNTVPDWNIGESLKFATGANIDMINNGDPLYIGPLNVGSFLFGGTQTTSYSLTAGAHQMVFNDTGVLTIDGIRIGSTIGVPVVGGTPNTILYVDGSGNLADSSDFAWDGSTKVVTFNSTSGTLGGASGAGYVGWQNGFSFITTPDQLGFVSASNGQVGIGVSDSGFTQFASISVSSSTIDITANTTTFSSVPVNFWNGLGNGQVLRYNGTSWGPSFQVGAASTGRLVWDNSHIEMLSPDGATTFDVANTGDITAVSNGHTLLFNGGLYVDNIPVGAVIGNPIVGGTANSILFVDASGNLGQDNANFTYNSVTTAFSVRGGQLTVDSTGTSFNSPDFQSVAEIANGLVGLSASNGIHTAALEIDPTLFTFGVDNTALATLDSNGLLTARSFTTATGTQGNWILGGNLNGVDADHNLFFKYQPNEVAADPFLMWVSQADMPPAQARGDQVFMMGWNLAGGGARYNNTAVHGAMGLSFEQYFEGGHNQMEGHWLYVDPADVQHRPISMLANLASPYDINLMIQAEGITLWGYRDQQTPAANVVLNQTTAQMRSPDGTNFIYIDNSNMLLRGIGASNVSFQFAGGATKAFVNQTGDLYFTSNFVGIINQPSNHSIAWDGSGNPYVAGGNLYPTGAQDLGTASKPWHDLLLSDGILGVGADLSVTAASGHNARLVSNNGTYIAYVDDSQVILRGGTDTFSSTGAGQFYTTVDLATSFAKDNLVDVGVASQRFRTGRFGTSVLTPSLDTDSATTLAIGGTTTTALTIGRTGITATFPSTVSFGAGATASGSSNFNLSGSSGTISWPTGGFAADLVPSSDNARSVGSTSNRLSTVNTIIVQSGSTAANDTGGSALTVRGQQGGPRSASSAGTGANVTILGGTGGAGDATHTAAAGGQSILRGGSGGTNSNGGSGLGGLAQVLGGTGSAGTASSAAGAGGSADLFGGDAGTNGGGGGNNGGNVFVRGGSASGAGINGAVVIGDSATRQVNLAASGITTAIAGPVSAANASNWDLSGSSGTWAPPTGGFTASLVPSGDNARNIGSATARIANLYVENIWSGSTAANDATGTGLSLQAQTGGTYSASLAGTGGQTLVLGGTGGAGDATHSAGVGGELDLYGGNGGTNNGGGGNRGGNVVIRGGTHTGVFTDGRVIIGDSSTFRVDIGASGVTALFNGPISASDIVKPTTDLVSNLGDYTHRFNSLYIGNDSVGTNQTVGISQSNKTAATNNNQKNSPLLEFEGQGWNPTASASRSTKMGLQLQPVQQLADEPMSRLNFWSDVNNGGYGSTFFGLPVAYISSDGSAGFGGQIFITTPTAANSYNSQILLVTDTNTSYMTGVKLRSESSGLSNNEYSPFISFNGSQHFGFLSFQDVSIQMGLTCDNSMYRLEFLDMFNAPFFAIDPANAAIYPTTDGGLNSGFPSLRWSKTFTKEVDAVGDDLKLTTNSESWSVKKLGSGIPAFYNSGNTGFYGNSTTSLNFVVNNNDAGGVSASGIFVPANAKFYSLAAATNTTGLTVESNVADGASSIGVLINNVTALPSGTGMIASFQANSVPMVEFDGTGDIIFRRNTGGMGYNATGALNNGIVFGTNFAALYNANFRSYTDNAAQLGEVGHYFAGVWANGAQFNDNSFAVSDANTGRLRYNDTLKQVEASIDTGAYKGVMLNDTSIDIAEFFAGNAANVSDFSGNEAGGMVFVPMKKNMVLRGVKFFWYGGHGALSVKVSLWDTTPTRIANVTVNVNAQGVYEAIFSSPQTLAIGTQYRISRWETTGAYDVYMSTGQVSTATGTAMDISTSFDNKHVSPGFYYAYGCYTSGDNYPSTNDSADLYGLTLLWQ